MEVDPYIKIRTEKPKGQDPRPSSKWRLVMTSQSMTRGLSSLASCSVSYSANSSPPSSQCTAHSPPSPRVRRTFGRERTWHDGAEGEWVLEGTKLYVAG
ncbi:unnamed protein product [Prunus armeniaca]